MKVLEKVKKGAKNKALGYIGDLQEFKAEFLKRSLPDQIYTVVYLLAVVSFILCFFLYIYSQDHKWTRAIFYSYIYAGSVACAWALSLEYKDRFLKLTKHLNIQRAALISVPIYVYAETRANAVIQKITNVDPGHLDHAGRALAVAHIPMGWLGLILLLLTLFVVYLQIKAASSFKNEKGYKGSVPFMRFVGAFALMFLFGKFINAYQMDNRLTSSIIIDIILATEYFPSDYCQGISEHELVAQLERGRISIYDQVTGSFRSSDCVFSNN